MYPPSREAMAAKLQIDADNSGSGWGLFEKLGVIGFWDDRRFFRSEID